ncbi:hypothetical protein CEUSTIGMA_g8763.t1 [Chlamydomonas eustigma]|uniref:F-box domain-containing protein n=1 Tax=Chlamydomonas eustigma TaxID=1157962 RepID=A0A250XEI9_9CHLO|nr:hypothetical protein CEUSTIGMA_g8763.t1 [Chlamydomonas eustigma]|eukprot:GAX81332.1 hypothetical protein CEUSTIGMA_g8763.t1 [Chlamydomonas eustigma]
MEQPSTTLSDLPLHLIASNLLRDVEGWLSAGNARLSCRELRDAVDAVNLDLGPAAHARNFASSDNSKTRSINFPQSWANLEKGGLLKIPDKFDAKGAAGNLPEIMRPFSIPSSELPALPKARQDFAARALDTLLHMLNRMAGLRSLDLSQFPCKGQKLGCLLAAVLSGMSGEQSSSASDFGQGDCTSLENLMPRVPSFLAWRTLVSLDLRGCTLGDLGSQALACSIKEARVLEYLDLSCNRVGDLGGVALADVLAGHDSLRFLCLRLNDLKHEAGEAIGKALSTNTTLIYLDLGGNEVGAATSIADSLILNTTLKYFDLSATGISHSFSHSLAKGISQNKILQGLVLSNTASRQSDEAQWWWRCSSSGSELTVSTEYLNVMDWSALCFLLSTNTALRLLDLRFCTIVGLDGDSAGMLLQAMHDNQLLALDSLDLSLCVLEQHARFILYMLPILPICWLELSGSDNMAGLMGSWDQISERLNLRPRLRHLGLGENSISDVGAVALARALGSNTCLTSLDLHGEAQALHEHKIGDLGFTAIAEALQLNTTLRRLDLSRNNVCVSGATDLSRALIVNFTLTHLDLSENKGVGAEGCAALGMALAKNGTLKSLNVSSCNLRDDGAKAIAEALMNNQNGLQELMLSGNDIGAVGCTAIGNALKKCGRLTALDLSFNDINKDIGSGASSLRGVQSLAMALTSDRSLRSLILTGNASYTREPAYLKLIQALSCNSTLRRLEIGDQYPDFPPSTKFYDALLRMLHVKRAEQFLDRGPCAITRLGLSNCMVSDRCCLELGEILKYNTSLCHLDLQANRIGAEGSAVLSALLVWNTSVRLLDLRRNNCSTSSHGSSASAAKAKFLETALDDRICRDT